MLSVVIPAYNEADAIEETIEEIHSILRSMEISEYEVIVVDDGSTDGTYERAKASEGRVLRHPHNVGYGRSIKDGIRAAAHDTIVITDADRTYPFREVATLLEKYNEGFDMVVGARTGANHRGSLVKWPLRKILRLLVEFAAGREIPDINSGLRIFSKKTSLEYVRHLCDTFSFTTSLTLAYMMNGRFVTYIPIAYQKRRGESKVRLFRDSLMTLQYILQAMTYYNPIKIFILFAFVCVCCSMFGFLMSALFHLNSGFLLGIGGLLVTLIVICFGLIADLLKQIMDKS